MRVEASSITIPNLLKQGHAAGRRMPHHEIEAGIYVRSQETIANLDQNRQTLSCRSAKIQHREFDKYLREPRREQINIPASKRPKFSAGKALKEAVNR